MGKTMQIRLNFKHRSILGISAFVISVFFGQVSAAQIEPGCDANEFKVFFQQFLQNPAWQQTVTADPMIAQSLSGDPFPEGNADETRFMGSALELFPTAERWAELGLVHEWLPPSTILLRDHQGRYLRTLIFALQPCWELKRVEDWVPGGSHLIGSSQSQSDAESCLTRGKVYEHLGSSGQTPIPQWIFMAALDSYLCAAEAGSLEASYAAASLSLSGQAPRLSNKKIETLLVAASEKLPEAALSLASFYCDQGDYSQQRACVMPEAAEQALIQSAQLGSADAINQLGRAYEVGSLGNRDIERALACYISAADTGLQLADQNARRLGEQGVRNKRNISCLPAGR